MEDDLTFVVYRPIGRERWRVEGAKCRIATVAKVVAVDHCDRQFTPYDYFSLQAERGPGSTETAETTLEESIATLARGQLIVRVCMPYVVKLVCVVGRGRVRVRIFA